MDFVKASLAAGSTRVHESTPSKYLNGQLQGTITEWYVSGSKKSARSFVNGVQAGQSTEWQGNGQPSKQELWTSGEALETLTWHKNGNRKEELRTHKGQLHRIVWSPAGQKIHETNGNTVSEWRIDGTQKSEQIRLRDGQVQMTEHHFKWQPSITNND